MLHSAAQRFGGLRRRWLHPFAKRVRMPPMRFWANNGDKEMQVEFLEEGWTKGRLKRDRPDSVGLSQASRVSMAMRSPTAAGGVTCSRMPMTKTTRHRCLKVLEVLSSKEDAEQFREPVDSAVPLYHKIILQPMDLGTVRSRLLTVKPQITYRHVSAFRRDVRLTFENCIAFNAADSEIANVASRMLATFDRLLKRWVMEYSDAANASGQSVDNIDDEVCQACGVNPDDREDELLFCDGCDAAYHLSCLTPALDSIPEEDWFCPHCARRREQLRELEAKKTAEKRSPRGGAAAARAAKGETSDDDAAGEEHEDGDIEEEEEQDDDTGEAEDSEDAGGEEPGEGTEDNEDEEDDEDHGERGRGLPAMLDGAQAEEPEGQVSGQPTAEAELAAGAQPHTEGAEPQVPAKKTGAAAPTGERTIKFRTQTPKVPWTEEEDEMLLKMVQAEGTGNWTDKARRHGHNRSSASLQQRWPVFLPPLPHKVCLRTPSSKLQGVSVRSTESE